LGGLSKKGAEIRKVIRLGGGGGERGSTYQGESSGCSPPGGRGIRKKRGREPPAYGFFLLLKGGENI